MVHRSSCRIPDGYGCVVKIEHRDGQLVLATRFRTPSFGDAWNWGLTDAEGGQRHRISPRELGYPVDQTPRIGAVAWWGCTNRSAGHVGIVVDVGPRYIMVASDSYGHGSTEITRLSPGRLYPTAFIHIGLRRVGGEAPL